MRGEVVLVRAFGGKPLKRLVWDVGTGVVYITNEEQFRNMVAGRRAIKPIGFPSEDVFEDIQDQSLDGSIDWSKLVPWQDETAPAQMTIGAPVQLKGIGATPQQDLRFEVHAEKEFAPPCAEQLHMFPLDGDTLLRNSKKAFDAKTMRRFSSSIKRVSKERTSQGSEGSLLAGLTATTS